jgi:3-keto-disaccharide hydrolase
MLRYSVLLLALSLSTRNATAPRALAVNEHLMGRWDISIDGPKGKQPSWLEVQIPGAHSSGDTYAGRFVGIVGSARPIERVALNGDSLQFSIPKQWEDGTGNLSVAARLNGSDALVGRMTFPDGSSANFTAVRAPVLIRARAPQWGTPVPLLPSSGLRGWHTQRGGASQWELANGVLRSPRSGENLVTDRTFTDFKLHVEFRFSKGSNSGIYLRGRHEVQVEDDYGLEPLDDRFAGVYGFLEPNAMAAKPAGEWNTYDITLIGRRITVVANGLQVICDQVIPGPTGGALDSNEGEPGPLLLQGDHGPVEYRNIVITPAR